MGAHEKHKLPLGWRASFGALPALAGQFSGPAIVLGRADGWVDELDEAFALTKHEAPVFAANGYDDAHYPGCDFEHVVGVHCAWFPEKEKRRADVTYHAEKPPRVCPKSDVFWPIPGTGAGSSALLAVLVALNMGFAPIYVAGVHLTKESVSDDGEGHKTIHSYRSFQDGWTALRGQLAGRVFSVSPRGTFLRDLLNNADAEE